MKGRFALLALAFSACADPEGGFDASKPVVVDEAPAELLSSYNLFAWSPEAGFEFNDRVVPYDLNMPLFSDYALKQRAVYLPEGTAATFEPEQALEFPVGTVLVKNFYFAADLRAPEANRKLIETRLLIRRDKGWDALPYVWDEDQQDA